MTATIQVDYFTPEVFTQIEKRLAVAIHAEATALARYHNRDLTATEVAFVFERDTAPTRTAVRELRGIHQALKRRLPVNLDAELYWSLTNE